MARGVLEELDVVGVLCVEFFVTRDGRLLINELAPRPHNSGHLTVDACVTSQFEQQLRAVCGLPLGSTEMHAAGCDGESAGRLWAQRRAGLGGGLRVPGCKAASVRQAGAAAGAEDGALDGAESRFGCGIPDGGGSAAKFGGIKSGTDE